MAPSRLSTPPPEGISVKTLEPDWMVLNYGATGPSRSKSVAVLPPLQQGHASFGAASSCMAEAARLKGGLPAWPFRKMRPIGSGSQLGAAGDTGETILTRADSEAFIDRINMKTNGGGTGGKRFPKMNGLPPSFLPLSPERKKFNLPASPPVPEVSYDKFQAPQKRKGAEQSMRPPYFLSSHLSRPFVKEPPVNPRSLPNLWSEGVRFPPDPQVSPPPEDCPPDLYEEEEEEDEERADLFIDAPVDPSQSFGSAHRHTNRKHASHCAVCLTEAIEQEKRRLQPQGRALQAETLAVLGQWRIEKGLKKQTPPLKPNQSKKGHHGQKKIEDEPSKNKKGGAQEGSRSLLEEEGDLYVVWNDPEEEPEDLPENSLPQYSDENLKKRLGGKGSELEEHSVATHTHRGDETEAEPEAPPSAAGSVRGRPEGGGRGRREDKKEDEKEEERKEKMRSACIAEAWRNERKARQRDRLSLGRCPQLVDTLKKVNGSI
uniref:Uncharacterized protein n=1 Tax=Chromera velia CCMP2878 TaxID=1169474 RepID=A0A0G4GX78_9ALVE|eukprot:Cvel_23762.t1-p1 / transcript=Cvel_23762.t1 / gene=Cvel_23762 / organism=Chromera_velia_CCMP2878 / gene_product=hypothetical protein / transcript_product=hypothetical protein / location=Cvel_scaffold2490:13538-14998(-) / protein_length=487 / sequence_SO=supercontig / SO=protein_coding / is_pseudo=false